MSETLSHLDSKILARFRHLPRDASAEDVMHAGIAAGRAAWSRVSGLLEDVPPGAQRETFVALEFRDAIAPLAAELLELELEDRARLLAMLIAAGSGFALAAVEGPS